MLNYAWEVTPAAAAQGGRGATTELFAPVQGFFQVPRISDLRVRMQPSDHIALHHPCAAITVAPCIGSGLPRHVPTIADLQKSGAFFACKLYSRLPAGPEGCSSNCIPMMPVHCCAMSPHCESV